LKPKAAPKPLTAAQILARTTKADQTRELRGTLGKKEKAKLQFSGQIVVSAQPATGAGASSTPTPVASQATPSAPETSGQSAAPSQTPAA
jgi:hypothetical protein